jgi:hypothetical protein
MFFHNPDGSDILRFDSVSIGEFLIRARETRK